MATRDRGATRCVTSTYAHAESRYADLASGETLGRHGRGIFATVPLTSNSLMSVYFSVVRSEAWRANACRTLGAAPAPAAHVIAVWRRAWKSTTRPSASSFARPAAAMSRSNVHALGIDRGGSSVAVGSPSLPR